MKLIQATSLAVGTTTEVEYFSSDGELLIAKGVTISPKHLEALRRRNICDLYYKETQSDNEIEALLSREFEDLDDLELDETTASRTPSAPPPLSQIPELKDIKFGKDGLSQLLESKRIADFERRIEKGFGPDRPIGAALSQSMTQMGVKERSAEYKQWVAGLYEEAVGQVRAVLLAIAGGNAVDGSYVRKIVERFMKTFVTDKNILLNLANVKSVNGDYLYNHSLNVCLLALNIAASFGYSEKQVVEIGVGAVLHDVGMLHIGEAIRFKKGRLTADEWFEVQKHPMIGLHLLEGVDHLPETAAIVAYQVHERENGSGYPRQRSSRVIHNYARIAQCADVFEAVSSPRSYRPAIAPYSGMEMLVKMARQGFLAGDYVKAFLMYTSLFPVGSIVELSDHTIARVIGANGSSFTKPMVSVVADQHGRLLQPSEIYQVDLKAEPELSIVKSHRYDFLENLPPMQGF